MLCKNCKNEIRDGSEFCKHCGQKVEKEEGFSFCTSCGKQIKSNSLFCKHCGASVGNAEKVIESNSKYNKRNLVMKVIAIAVVVVVGFALFPRDEEKRDKQTGEYTNPKTGDKGETLINPGLQGVSENDNCFVCGGDGKKDCTSCDGGYYVEYESGTYLGYGPTTREVRKKCNVCRGSGEVKCYH